MAAWNATGREPEQLKEHGQCPENLSYLWDWFLELRLPVNYTELHHWQSATRRTLSAWEVDLIMKLDRMVLND